MSSARPVALKQALSDVPSYIPIEVSENGGIHKAIGFNTKIVLFGDDEMGYPHFRKPPYHQCM